MLTVLSTTLAFRWNRRGTDCLSLASHLPDPKDDLVLELALAGSAQFIITRNTRDFQGVDSLGIQAVTPDGFLRILSAL